MSFSTEDSTIYHEPILGVFISFVCCLYVLFFFFKLGEALTVVCLNFGVNEGKKTISFHLW